MPFNGTGTFDRVYNWEQDAANGIKIRADRMDVEDDGFATGLTDCVTRDGQSPPSANLPMNNKRHTGVQDGVSATDYASLSQAQKQVQTWVNATGTGDALVVAMTPTMVALVDGMTLHVRAAEANTIVAPTITVDANAAGTIKKNGGSALIPGDIPNINYEMTLRYHASDNHFELLNPKGPSVVVAAGKTLTANKSLTLDGTDGTTQTFPGTSATIARTDAGQTFTGNQNVTGSITPSGGLNTDVIVNRTSGSRVTVTGNGVGAGGVVMDFRGTDNTFTMSICDMDAGGANNSGVALQIQKVSGTGRSISAAGTINASGADYAEYEKKSAKCGEIAKGQIVGFDADGQLTDSFSASISFGIKSTDPSYVGGDAWGNEEAMGIAKPQEPIIPVLEEEEPVTVEEEPLAEPALAAVAVEQAAPVDRVAAHAMALEQYKVEAATYEKKRDEFEAALEVARQGVDRIAYSGKVPVNVTGAAPGDYIIAIQDGDAIAGKIVASPTFDQYLRCVGRVRKILPDGRAVVSVIIH